MGLKIKLVKSFAGASKSQLATMHGLGLWKFGQERILKDTPANRGMVFKMQHLVSHEIVPQDPPKKTRRKPRKIVQRDRARAASSKASAKR
jgi:large subunit ribosomal protein L30